MSPRIPPSAAPPVFNPPVSLFPNAFENLPTDIPAAQFIAGIRGHQHKALITEIRDRFKTAIGRGVPYDKAKRVIDSQKKKLPSVSFAGVLPMRGKDLTPQFTGLYPADLDLLGDRLTEIRAILCADPCVYAVFDSPTGEGLKAIYRVPICQNGDQYKLVYATVAAHVQELTGVAIDKLEDFTRLCFASHDPHAHLNPDAVELPVDFSQPASQPGPTTKTKSTSAGSESRRAIAERLLGEIAWDADILGHCTCPGAAQHTAGESPRECRVYIDGTPTIHCMHRSCEAEVADANKQLRDEILRSSDPTIRGNNSHHASSKSEQRNEYWSGEQAEGSSAAGSSTPGTPIAKRLDELVAPTPNDQAELLRHRYLCRGGGLLLVGPTGIGKSSFSIQAMILWAIGRAAFGIKPARPLKSLLIQAENDEGDLAEMRDGVIAGLNLTDAEKQSAMANVIVAREDSRTGMMFFAGTVRPLLAEHRPDLLWIDPALSYLGAEANSQKDVGGLASCSLTDRYMNGATSARGPTIKFRLPGHHSQKLEPPYETPTRRPERAETLCV